MKYEKPQILDLSDEIFIEGQSQACKPGSKAQGVCQAGNLPTQTNCSNGPNATNSCTNGSNGGQ